jgi:hypothetical protein
MFYVEADKSRNLLTISYSQRVGPDEIKACATEVEAALPELTPGFRLLTDLTRLESMERSCIPVIRQIMDVLNKLGITQVVRVIPDPSKDVGLNIMSLFHYRRDVSIVTCQTLEEALRTLN